MRRLSERHDRLINRLIDKQLLKAFRKRQFPFLPAGIYDLSTPAAAAVGARRKPRSAVSPAATARRRHLQHTKDANHYYPVA